MNWYDLVSSLSETESRFSMSKWLKMLRATHLLCGNEKKSRREKPAKTKPIQIKVCFKVWGRNSPLQIPKLLLGCTFHKAVRTQDLYITHLREFALLGLHFTAVSQTRKLPVCAIQMHLWTDGETKKSHKWETFWRSVMPWCTDFTLENQFIN